MITVTCKVLNPHTHPPTYFELASYIPHYLYFVSILSVFLTVIDLESVWSVKDMVLDSPAKPTADLDTQVKASTSYYSRHGGYKTNTGTGTKCHKD